MIKQELMDSIAADLVETTLLKKLGLQTGDMRGIVVRANSKLSQGDAVGAFADFAALVLMDPTAVEYQIGLSEAATQSNQAALGMQAAAIVITEMPDDPEGYYLSGKAALAMDEKEIAAVDLRDAIDRCKDKSEKTALLKSARQLLSLAEAS